MNTPFSRREFLRTSALATGAGFSASLWQSRLLAAADAPTPSLGGPPRIPPGPFSASRESLKAYVAPDWFRDAKFGIFCHWGPQSAAEYGDWYARRMYIEGEAQYKHHLEHYGHPSKTGFALMRITSSDYIKMRARSILSAWGCTTTTLTCGIPNTSPSGTRQSGAPKKISSDCLKKQRKVTGCGLG